MRFFAARRAQKALLDRIAFTPTSKLIPIPWPAGLAPSVVPSSASDTDPLPSADVLVVTYTSAEGVALSDVLSPGRPSSAWTRYRNGWPALKALIVGKRAPSLFSDCAGVWCTVSIAGLKVVLVKSDLHPATDGPNVPMVALWQQMIAQVQPQLVITTGTAGGVGTDTQLGDVIVTSSVKWFCTGQFKNKSWAKDSYTSNGGEQALASYPVQRFLQTAQETLIPVNSSQIPRVSGAPTIWTDVDSPCDVLTCDSFAFDDLRDSYGLRSFDGAARACEMDDAALGVALALASAAKPPSWLSVRNASDPQENAPTLAAEKKAADATYQRWGYQTTVGSAITCAAIIAGLADGA